MSVKNEENTIERCLESVIGVVDEVIIVDTGSDDRTKEIAAKFTDKIFDFEWIDDFSAARNYSFEKATMDYILWLDADDIILAADADKLADLKKSISPDTDVIMMKYNTGFDATGNVIFSCFRERMVKRSCGLKWFEPVHEYLEIRGKVLNTDICVTHAKQSTVKSARNINIYENLLKKGVHLSPRGEYYYARELKDHARFSEAIERFSEFLDSDKGWLEDKIVACGELADCYIAVDSYSYALTAMFRSFNYDVPRAEMCCRIGYYFSHLNKYRLAIFWFDLAMKTAPPINNWGFQRDDCYGYIPCVESAVCYDRLGDYKRAAEYNELAATYKPLSPIVLINRKYFESKLSKQK